MSKKIESYQIVSQPGKEGCEAEVRKFMEQGWEPFGAATLAQISQISNGQPYQQMRFTQAMIKYEQAEQDPDAGKVRRAN